ncbi:MAG: hypothetical protein QM820_48115 [Minicystis sp.]
MLAAQGKRSRARVSVDDDRDDVSLQRAVEDAEAEVERGEVVEHDVMMAKLRRWADGGA